jgi:Tol biopolymer transport system component
MVAALAVAITGVAPWVSRPAPARARPASRSPTKLSSCPTGVRRLGLVAFVADNRLDVVDLRRCRVTVRRAPGAGEVRFSPDGRWLAYAPLLGGNLLGPEAPSGPEVIPVYGGAARSPLGKGIVAWSWSRSGALLYGVTNAGALVQSTPRGPRRILATGVETGYYGIDGPFAVSPNGQLAAVDRSTCQPTVGELDTVNLSTGARTVVLRRPGEFLTLAGWSPDGRWLLFWTASMCSASLAADGWPLEAVPATGGSPVRVVPHMLLYDDFLSWCGNRLIAAAGPDRQSNSYSKLMSAAPPGWRAQTIQPARALSWVSPRCAPGGRVLAAAAGPNSNRAQFGIQHRSIWLLRPSGEVIRRLTLPPATDLSDEAPRFSRDGRWVMFVRSRVLPVRIGGASADTLELERATGAGGAVPIVSFTSGDFSYYDHFDWPYEVDWLQPG